MTSRRGPIRIAGMARRRPVGRYMVVDPRVCHGKLTFSGTRVPVETVLHYLARGKTLESILEDWPELTGEAVEEALELTASVLEREFTTTGARGG